MTSDSLSKFLNLSVPLVTHLGRLEASWWDKEWDSAHRRALHLLEVQKNVHPSPLELCKARQMKNGKLNNNRKYWTYSSMGKTACSFLLCNLCVSGSFQRAYKETAHNGFVLLYLRTESLYPKGQKGLIKRQKVPRVLGLRPLLHCLKARAAESAVFGREGGFFVCVQRDENKHV